MSLKKPQKQPAAVYREEISRQSVGLSSLLWMIAGIVTAVIFVLFLYLSPLFDGFRQKPTIQTEAPVTPITDTTSPIEFEFYEVLPKQKFQSIPQGVGIQERVTDHLPSPKTDLVLQVPNDAKAVSNTNSQDAQGNRASDHSVQLQINYILQIKSYDNAQEADLKRAEVLMAGVDAVVVRHQMPTGDYLYQVISTPMQQQDAFLANTRLRNNGIDSLIIEQHAQVHK